MEMNVAVKVAAIRGTDSQSIAMDLLDQYGTSVFVDAIEASRFDRVFKKHSTLLKNGDRFWVDVRARLEQSAVS